MGCDKLVILCGEILGGYGTAHIWVWTLKNLITRVVCISVCFILSYKLFEI